MTIFKRTVRSGLLAAVAALGLAASQAPASAATFAITFKDFTNAVVGSGQFDAAGPSAPITSFNATVNGVQYDTLPPSPFNLFAAPTLNAGANQITGNVLPITGILDNNPPSAILAFIGGTNIWGSVACLGDSTQCPVARKGTYSIGAIPLPGALPLFAAGLAGVGYVSRRKRKAAMIDA